MDTHRESFEWRKRGAEEAEQEPAGGKGFGLRLGFGLSRGCRGEMKSQIESKKGERLIRGVSTSGLASREQPGRPGNGWRGLSGLDSGSVASRAQERER